MPQDSILTTIKNNAKNHKFYFLLNAMSGTTLFVCTCVRAYDVNIYMKMGSKQITENRDKQDDSHCPSSTVHSHG